MIELNPGQIAELYRRSFYSVDGLWFMKVEEKYGFEAALEIDNEVWKVLPKLQARVLKGMLKVESGMEALFACLTTRLALDGFTFKTEKTGDGFRVIIERCPWHELMVKSGRGTLSGRVGALICNTEYAVFASEFDKGISFKPECQICNGSESCIMQFRK